MILVTGGTGLIGSNLLYELSLKNDRIRAIKRPASDIRNVLKIFGYYSENPETLFKKIEWVDADIGDYIALFEAFENVDRVYHCAGMISYNRRIRKKLFETNVTGTANVVNIGLERNVKKLCHVSSIASFGEYDGIKPIDEKTRWNPGNISSLYSLSKLKAEMEVWRGIAEGLEGIIVNPSVVLGPGFWKNGVGKAYSLVSKGMRFYTLGSTGYVDVRDVARIMIRLMESGISGEQFLISSENFTFKEILDLISASLNRRNPDIRASRFLTGLGWRISELSAFFTGKQPVITRDNMNISHKYNLYSGQKVRDVLNYDYIPVKDSIQFLTEKYMMEMNHS
jgi:nucleoside-diphosphate-sugar epimerase